MLNDSRKHLFHQPSDDPTQSRTNYYSYLQPTQRLLAALQRTGILPHWLIYIDHNHVGAEPLLIAARQLRHILVPFVRCDDRTTVTKEITPHMLTRWAVAQIDLTLRMLENLAIVAHQGCISFIPKDGPVPQTIEAVQADVLQIGAIELQHCPKRKKTPNEFCLARA